MNKGTRIINLSIDILVISIFTIIISTVSGLEIKFLSGGTFLIYYCLFEYFIGQTVGKMVTNTIVVDSKKQRPGLFKIFIRTLLRFSSLDKISYLFGTEFGIHDTLSKTMLIRKSHI